MLQRELYCVKIAVSKRFPPIDLYEMNHQETAASAG